MSGTDQLASILQDVRRMQEDCVQLRAENNSFKIDFAAMEKENEMLRTLLLEETQKRERIQRLYFSIVTELRMVDGVMREAFARAREYAKDFPIDDLPEELHGGPDAVREALAEMGKLATESSIGHDDKKPIPKFLNKVTQG